MDSLVTTVSIEELNIKSIVDLIDEMAQTFHYIPSDRLGYIGFNTNDDLLDFCNKVSEIKSNLVNLENSYYTE